MKKVILVISCIFIFIAAKAQFLDQSGNWAEYQAWGGIWRPSSVSVDAFSSLYGSRNAGFLFRSDFSSTDLKWGVHPLGLVRGDATKLNLACSISVGDPVVLSGYWGLGFRTREGMFTMTENGVVVIGQIPNSALRAIANPANYYDNYYKLYVADGIRTEKIKVDLQATWGDYVFDKHYKLTPLSIVECTIEEKGHLHDMPSAAELKKDGLDLGNMATMQQVKIEELFLHLIDMDKRLKALEAENAKLKAELNNLKK